MAKVIQESKNSQGGRRIVNTLLEKRCAHGDGENGPPDFQDYLKLH